jgi:hypothetical protein
MIRPSLPIARRAALGLAAGLAVLPTLRPRPALACTCARLSPAEAFKQAGAVFAGTVVETHPVADPGFVDLAESRVTVEQVMKGDPDPRPGAQVVISHGIDLNACGIALGVGDRLLFFTDPVVDGHTRTSYCSMLHAEQYAAGGAR